MRVYSPEWFEDLENRAEVRARKLSREFSGDEDSWQAFFEQCRLDELRQCSETKSGADHG